jgi:ribosomal protein S18 acetylase RimI-like enzyme
MQQNRAMSDHRVLVRPARPGEADSLPPIERSAAQAFLALPDLAWVATDDVLSVEAHHHFMELGGSWVAELDGRIAGFACAQSYGADLHVWEVAVAHEVQGQGAGTALMEAVKAHAAQRHLRRVTLTTFRDVAWNEGFYRRLGFRVLAREELDHRLSQVLDLEYRQGLPLERRCAMSYVVEPA